MHNHPGNSQFLRFVLVGGLNTAFSYGVYVLLLIAGFGYVMANFGALLLGIPVSFRSQGALVFGNREWRRLLRFILVWTLLFIFNICMIAILLRVGFNAYVAGALTLLPVTALSYLLQKFFVFQSPRADMADPERPATQSEVGR